MSGISWLLEATMYYMVGRAFNIDIGFEYFLLVTASANLAISVLASQGGIGPFELVTKQVIVSAGIAEASAQAYAIGLHALLLLPVIAVGLYLLTSMGMSLGEMFRGSQSARSTPGPNIAAAALPPREVPP
jgi:uncharacterized membrane protein YbhN (UPF0104 family)